MKKKTRIAWLALILVAAVGYRGAGTSKPDPTGPPDPSTLTVTEAANDEVTSPLAQTADDLR